MYGIITQNYSDSDGPQPSSRSLGGSMGRGLLGSMGRWPIHAPCFSNRDVGLIIFLSFQNGEKLRQEGHQIYVNSRGHGACSEGGSIWADFTENGLQSVTRYQSQPS